MKAFVLSIIYAESADVSCGQARVSKWHKLKNKSAIRLPPDDDSLNLQMERSNYLTLLPAPLQPTRASFSHWSLLGTSERKVWTSASNPAPLAAVAHTS